VADGPVSVNDQTVDRAHHEAPLAVVAEERVDRIDDRKVAALGDGSLGTGRLTGPAAEALLDEDLEGHVRPG